MVYMVLLIYCIIYYDHEFFFQNLLSFQHKSNLLLCFLKYTQ